MASATSYIIGALITTLAPGFVIMVIGRFIYGVGIGLAMHAAPMYIAETAASEIRGRLISLKEFFIVTGMVLGYVVGSLLVDVTAGWRYMYATAIPFAVIMIIGMWWLPASPRWIILRAIQGKGDMQDLREYAIYCLRRLRGEAIINSATQEVEEIIGELSYISEEGEATFGELFQGKCLKALTIGAGLVLFQHITGQPSVLYYAASIFQTAGFSAASDATNVFMPKQNHLLEHAFDVMLEAGEIPPSSFFVEIICRSIIQDDFDRALTILNSMAHAPFQVQEKEWRGLFEEYKRKITRSHLHKLFDKIGTHDVAMEASAYKLSRLLQSLCGSKSKSKSNNSYRMSSGTHESDLESTSDDKGQKLQSIMEHFADELKLDDESVENFHDKRSDLTNNDGSDDDYDSEDDFLDGEFGKLDE